MDESILYFCKRTTKKDVRLYVEWNADMSPEEIGEKLGALAGLAMEKKKGEQVAAIIMTAAEVLASRGLFPVMEKEEPMGFPEIVVATTMHLTSIKRGTDLSEVAPKTIVGWAKKFLAEEKQEDLRTFVEKELKKYRVAKVSN